MDVISVALAGILLAFFIFLVRRFGAWMMRIDEVIELEQEILDELRKSNRINEQRRN